METQEDCIYFEKDKEDKDYVICTSLRHYCKNTDENNMCHSCRLWDNYIPNTSSKEEIAYAQKRQHLKYEELIKDENDYYEYFKGRI